MVGTRSAVFAPLPSVGLIVVDEEHDASYKQDESPRYHGRDVAIMRGKARRSPSSCSGRRDAVPGELPPRGQRPLPAFHPCRNASGAAPSPTCASSTCATSSRRSGPDVVLSAPLAEAIDRRLADREQALVLLNRRGFAASLLCRGCGHTLECPDCSVSLTFHRAAGRARCHYCGYSRARPAACPRCSATVLEHVGFGTELGAGGARAAVAGRPRRPARPRHGSAAGRGGTPAPAGGAPRAGCPRRHPDGGEGARLPRRHPGGRGVGGHRSRGGGLPGGGSAPSSC